MSIQVASLDAIHVAMLEYVASCLRTLLICSNFRKNINFKE